MDVGPLVIPHARAAKLTEPRKCALHNPTPPAQATPMRGATHREPRHDMPRPQPAESPSRRSRQPREHRSAAVAVGPVRRVAGE
jgi:hypothetical protein